MLGGMSLYIVNQNLRIHGVLERFCTLNCNISTGSRACDLTPL